MNDFKLVKTNPFYLIRSVIYDSIAEHSKELAGVLLDFGCGQKPYINLFKHVEKYIGLDYKNDGHSHENEQIDVFYDGENIPFPDNYFDSILSTEVFEHVFNLEVTLKEINRVLKPNGRILITCPFVWNLHEEPNDFARYTPYALEYLLKKNGFDIIKLEKKGDFRTALAQINIIFYQTDHFLLNIPLLNTWMFNNRIFSYRKMIKSFIAYYYNAFFLLRKKRQIAPRNDLFLTNVVLANKRAQ